MLTVVNHVQQDCKRVLSQCVWRWSWDRIGQHVCISQPASVTAGNPIPVPWYDMEKPCATVSLPDLVVLPITRWLPCDLMVKLFDDHTVTTFHQADRSSQNGFLLMQLQDKNLCGLLADSGFAAWKWSSRCCQSPESEYCNAGGYSGY